MRKDTTKQPVAAVAAITGALCLLLYLRALSCGFINWDDQEYILNNGAIRSLDWQLVRWAFTNYEVGWWFPLTWISFALDYRLWGGDPFGYHLVNILLHSVNTVLVALLAYRLCRGMVPETADSRLSLLIPAVAALFFGMHPLRVESVAWVSERKDVLNGVFSIGAMLCYLEYAACRGTGREWRKSYCSALALFILSLCAKPVSVVIPLLMLVIDRYPLGRFNRYGVWPLIREKLPFLAASGAISAFTMYGAVKTASVPLGLTMLQRVVISGNALFEYIRMMLFPMGIIPLYIIPYPIPAAYPVKAVLFAVIFTGVVVAGFRKPWLMTIWLCFLIPFLPVLAITQNGIQSHAARFTYLPSISLSIGAAAGVALLSANASRVRQWGIWLLLVLLLSSYGIGTWRMIGVWRDSGSFWTRVISYQPFDRAYFYRALFHLDHGNYAAAVEDYTICLDIAEKERLPELFNIFAFRGEALARWGRHEDAVRDFTSAIALSPHPLYFRHRGESLLKIGRGGDAEEDFRRSGDSGGQMRWFPN